MCNSNLGQFMRYTPDAGISVTVIDEATGLSKTKVVKNEAGLSKLLENNFSSERQKMEFSMPSQQDIVDHLAEKLDSKEKALMVLLNLFSVYKDAQNIPMISLAQAFRLVLFS